MTRSPARPATLCLLLGVLPLGIASGGAAAAPTVEEEALKAALERRPADAIRTLERDGDPHLRWVAGRVALEAGDAATAGRLFSAPGVGGVWDQVDLALRRGDASGAAGLALTEMDHALAGVHRDALGRLLIGWAGERVAKDEPNAARFLLAVLGLAPSADVRRAAEDQLFRLSAESSGADGAAAARRRLLEDPGCLPARYRVAVALADTRPLTAATWLADLVREAPEDDALAAARQLVGLPAPDPLVLDALRALGERFPSEDAVAQLRLNHARALADRDEALGTSALAALASVPGVATDALEARAIATRDPQARRALWLALAEREGASARGENARREAYASLLEAARALPTAEARRVFAEDGLKQPDGAGTPDLLYLAIPDGAGRTDALWSLAERFPRGAWCTELGERLVTAGASVEVAQRFSGTCPTANTDADAGDAARILGFTAINSAQIVLRPRAGGIDVLSAATPVLHVSEHHVDAEALFRATTGNPLDQPLDAFLLDPDATWDIKVADGIVRPIPIQPRASGLVTLTVRADDQRATALVVSDPLAIQIVRREGDVALAVFRGADAAIVAGAELLIQDDAGGIHTAKTDAHGIALLHGLPSALRVMARKGRALGFAVADDSYSGEETVATSWDVVLWDRAVSATGAWADVEVYATRPAGTGATRAVLQSLDRQGGVLQAVPMDAAAFVDGAAHVRLFVQGGGALSVVAEDEEVASVPVPSPPSGRRDVRITWQPAAPHAGESLVATLETLVPQGPGGIAGEVTVTTPWSTVTRPVVLTAEGVHLPVDLAVAQPDDPVEVSFRYADGEAVGSGVTVGGDVAPGPVHLPAVVGKGAVVPVEADAGSWVHATIGGGGAAGEPQIWRRVGEGLTLPRAGRGGWRRAARSAVRRPPCSWPTGTSAQTGIGRALQRSRR